jgi:hypothetical protein
MAWKIGCILIILANQILATYLSLTKCASLYYFVYVELKTRLKPDHESSHCQLFTLTI